MREGLMDDTGYDPMPYSDSTLEEIEQKGFVSGYQDGVVEACASFVERLEGRIGKEELEKISEAVTKELHEYILNL